MDKSHRGCTSPYPQVLLTVHILLLIGTCTVGILLNKSPGPALGSQ